MGFVEELAAGLGLSTGPSLAQIKKMSASVKPEYMDQLAELFDRGGVTGSTGNTQLGSAIDQVVTGWKGKAADAASTKTLKTSMNSQDIADNSTAYSARARRFAATIREHQAKIAAVEPVDTSYGAAVQSSGGPVIASVFPAATQAKQFEARMKAEKHRAEAAKYLSSMNDDGKDYPDHEGSFATAKRKGVWEKGALPRSLSVQQPGKEPDPPPTQNPTPTPTPTPTTGGDSGGGSGSGGGPGGSGGAHPGLPGHVVHPGFDGTSPTGGNLTGTSTQLPAAASAGPVESGGTNLGLAGGLAAGGGALAVAGGLAGGLGRGALAGGRGPAGAGADSFARNGLGAGGNGMAGSGAGDADGPGRGVSGRGLAGEAAEASALRSGATSSALAGEAAAARNGFMPGAPGMGAGGRQGDDDELERRPDYLVASDDIWGDGRLAAPPVLG